MCRSVSSCSSGLRGPRGTGRPRVTSALATPSTMAPTLVRPPAECARSDPLDGANERRRRVGPQPRLQRVLAARRCGHVRPTRLCSSRWSWRASLALLVTRGLKVSAAERTGVCEGVAGPALIEPASSTLTRPEPVGTAWGRAAPRPRRSRSRRRGHRTSARCCPNSGNGSRCRDRPKHVVRVRPHVSGRVRPDVSVLGVRIMTCRFWRLRRRDRRLRLGSPGAGSRRARQGRSRPFGADRSGPAARTGSRRVIGRSCRALVDSAVEQAERVDEPIPQRPAALGASAARLIDQRRAGKSRGWEQPRFGSPGGARWRRRALLCRDW